MATLRELLDAREDKTKPIKARQLHWPKEVFMSIQECSLLDWFGFDWDYYEEPKKKVKNYAHLNRFSGVLFFSTGIAEASSYIRLPQFDVEVEE